MIHFEIIESPDKNTISKFQFFQNEIYLGKKTGNLVINDTQLLDTHMMVEVVDKELIVHPQKNVESYLIDGKRATTIRKIKIGQSIKIGSTILKVLAFEETNFPSKKTILEAKLNQLSESNSSLIPVIEKITKLMN